VPQKVLKRPAIIFGQLVVAREILVFMAGHQIVFWATRAHPLRHHPENRPNGGDLAVVSPYRNALLLSIVESTTTRLRLDPTPTFRTWASTAHTLSRSSPIVFPSRHTESSSKSDNFSDPTRRRNTRAAAAPVFLSTPFPHPRRLAQMDRPGLHAPGLRLHPSSLILHPFPIAAPRIPTIPTNCA
jgi:hypothetical protein